MCQEHGQRTHLWEAVSQPGSKGMGSTSGTSVCLAEGTVNTWQEGHCGQCWVSKTIAESDLLEEQTEASRCHASSGQWARTGRSLRAGECWEEEWTTTTEEDKILGGKTIPLQVTRQRIGNLAERAASYLPRLWQDQHWKYRHYTAV